MVPAMESIGTAERMSGIKVETIRFYEREGIVPPPVRSETGRRLYDNAAIARLRFVRRCRDLGMPLPYIKTLLQLAEDSEMQCSEARAVGARHLSEIRRKMQRLAKIERTIMVHLDRCSDDLAKCPMLNDLLYGLDAPALPD